MTQFPPPIAADKLKTDILSNVHTPKAREFHLYMIK